MVRRVLILKNPCGSGSHLFDVRKARPGTLMKRKFDPVYTWLSEQSDWDPNNKIIPAFFDPKTMCSENNVQGF
jgi:hypothetical protein